MRSILFCIALMTWHTATLADDLPPGIPFQPAPEQEVTKPLAKSAGNDGLPSVGILSQPPIEATAPIPKTTEDTVIYPPLNGNQPPKLIDLTMEESAQSSVKKSEHKINRKSKSRVKGAASDMLSAKLAAPPPNGVSIKPKPGTTTTVTIARSRLNRIVTPYASPKVLTIDQLETKVDDSVIYVATDSTIPVDLYITDQESNNAISLQLLPMDIENAVEIRIEADIKDNSTFRETDTGQKDSEYLSEIKRIMRELAKQRIPEGFSMAEFTAELKDRRPCHSALVFTPGQFLSTHDFIILIYAAQNNTNQSVNFEEQQCASRDTLAVAAWPKIKIAPGDKTEVYVLMRVSDKPRQEDIRPSLL